MVQQEMVLPAFVHKSIYQQSCDLAHAMRLHMIVASLLHSVTPGSQETFEDLGQQEKAMAAFMDNFPSSKAGKLAELEGMQMAGASRQEPYGRTSIPDMPPLPFDESQVCATHELNYVASLPYVEVQVCAIT